VNPNRFDEEFPDKNMAAVGVAFLFIIALRKKLREKRWFFANNKDNADFIEENIDLSQIKTENSSRVMVEEPNLFEFLDLVALGTICDVVPLTLLNRTMVQHGLRYLARNSNLGLTVLMEQARIETKLSAYHLGYVLGPRINAGGRIDESSLGTQLLTTKDELHAREIAKRLEHLNNERKTIEQQAVEEAIAQIETQKIALESPVIAVYSHSWHIGILGILASRLKEKYRKPCLVMAIKDGLGKGSGRSIAGFNVGQVLARAKEKGLLMDGGGHAMAGGFTVNFAKIDEFISYANAEFQKNQTAEAILHKARELEIDAVVRASAVNVQLLNFLDKLGPFGQGNSQPRFMMRRVRLVKTIATHKNHLIMLVEDIEKLYIRQHNLQKNSNEGRILSGDEGQGDSRGDVVNTQNNEINSQFNQNTLVKCIAFRGLENEIGNFILNNSNKIFNIAGLIQASNIEFGKVDFIVDDISVEN
jgi:single-stranded-DNA-specific exonuclease